jgi:acetyl esterase
MTRDAAMIDPAIRQLLDRYFAAPEAPGEPDIARLRAAALDAPRLFGGAPPALAEVRDAAVAGPAGPVPIRIYRPSGAGPLPLFLHAHGGGWVAGSLASHDTLCRILADRLSAILVAVDYRLAPEHVYPAALDDVDAAWCWVREEARSLGSDPLRHAVVGDSSGGNLAAALTLRLRARGEPQPARQVLLYPALDAGSAAASYREFASGYNLSAAQMRWFWNIYRGGSPVDDPQLAPLAAQDLSGLAPAVVAVAGADVLRDEAVAYAVRLAAAGVPTELVDCKGMIHGFLRWTGAVPAAHTWIDIIATAARL